MWLFFPLLFAAAYRLPGGVAAVTGALEPFVVAGLSSAVLGHHAGRRALLAAALGVAGVALLVLRSETALDPVGLLAAAAGTLSMSTGIVLGRRWGTPDGFSGRGSALIALTGWQLTAGGLVLLPVALAVEGPLPALSLPRVSLLALLSPVVATMLGWKLWTRP